MMLLGIAVWVFTIMGVLRLFGANSRGDRSPF